MRSGMKVITRKEWGARLPGPHTIHMFPEAIRFLVVHYSGVNADEQSHHANCAERVRAIQAYHMDAKGWNDIAYNWIVCKHGAIFRGRGFGFRSAATGPANSYTVAVCFLGDDTKGRDDVTEQGRQAIRDVWAFCKRNAVNVEGCRGHRDFMATTCPGDELYAFCRKLT